MLKLRCGAVRDGKLSTFREILTVNLNYFFNRRFLDVVVLTAYLRSHYYLFFFFFSQCFVSSSRQFILCLSDIATHQGVR